MDDFKLAGPKEHLHKGWELIKSAVDIGEPEAYDRYFAIARNFQVKLTKSARPLAHVFSWLPFDPSRSRDTWSDNPKLQTDGFWTGSGIARPTVNESEPKGRLQSIASKVLMKILFAARMARFDLL